MSFVSNHLRFLHNRKRGMNKQSGDKEFKPNWPNHSCFAGHQSLSCNERSQTSRHPNKQADSCQELICPYVWTFIVGALFVLVSWVNRRVGGTKQKTTLRLSCVWFLLFRPDSTCLGSGYVYALGRALPCPHRLGRMVFTLYGSTGHVSRAWDRSIEISRLIFIASRDRRRSDRL